MAEDGRHAARQIGKSLRLCGLPHALRSVPHRDAEPGVLDHIQIVVIVAQRHHRLARHMKAFRQFPQGRALAHALWHQFQDGRPGGRDLQTFVRRQFRTDRREAVGILRVDAGDLADALAQTAGQRRLAKLIGIRLAAGYIGAPFAFLHAAVQRHHQHAILLEAGEGDPVPKQRFNRPRGYVGRQITHRVGLPVRRFQTATAVDAQHRALAQPRVACVEADIPWVSPATDRHVDVPVLSGFQSFDVGPWDALPFIQQRPVHVQRNQSDSVHSAPKIPAGR